MTTDTRRTQPAPDRRAELLAPLVSADALTEPNWLAHAYAAAAWTWITEPGDEIAGLLTGTLGNVTALELVIYGQADEIRERVQRSTGMQMMEPHTIDAALKRWRPRWNREHFEDCLLLAARNQVHLLTEWDEDWPEGMARLGTRSPLALWYRGDPSVMSLPAVAMVGARAATSYGEHVAMDLASSTSRSHVIVSGAAYGIDGAAHRAALASGGKTIAYLAGGVDRPYPAGHANLISRIAEHGVLVSEVPPGGAPTKWRFLARNRLIAAHGDALVVVEAGWRSGSLSTATHALTLGKPIGAVPGPITSAASMGCHRLLREGAVCITSQADIDELLAG